MTTASPRSLVPGRDRLPGGFDPRRLRQEFPIFANNPNLVFLEFGGKRTEAGRGDRRDRQLLS